MTESPPADATPGRTPGPVVWGVGILCLLLLVAAWGWRTLIGGLFTGDEKSGSPDVRPAVQAAEQTGHALQEADRDGTLTDQEARSAVAGGGVLTRLQRGDASASLTVAFPYALTPAPPTGPPRGYMCVDFEVLAGQGVDTHYRGSCPAHPRPATHAPGPRAGQ